jgi:putative endonuclease
MLRRGGYRVIARNVRGMAGELDIVCLAPDRRTLVFVEVKTRVVPEGVADPLPPEVNVTHDKRQKLIRLAREYARKKGMEGRPLRIDVVTVQVPARGEAVVRHLVDAVKR